MTNNTAPTATQHTREAYEQAIRAYQAALAARQAAGARITEAQSAYQEAITAERAAEKTVGEHTAGYDIFGPPLYLMTPGAVSADESDVPAIWPDGEF